MTAKKIDKLEQRLYRTIRDIREASNPNNMMNYIRRFGRLEQQYIRLTGMRFTPIHDHDSLQDVEWRTYT